MSNPRKQGSNGDLSEKSNGDDLEVSSSISGGDGDYAVGYGGDSGERSEIGMSERLTDVGVEQGDGGLLVQRSGSEDMVLQWLMALDVQVMGACRAEERLKPLLKLNAPSGIAEDRLLAHLSQHFEPSEVGMLARCFCIPLVSIRVGKINKQGTLLCPTATRGNLSLTLLPTSDLRLSFIGDDGNTERLFTLNSESQCSAVVLDEITADSSGRSFLVKIPDVGVFYFWCSDKSKLLGIELLAKMKDILKRKPSIADLTGISKLRLDCFATHLRAYLVGSNAGQSSSSPGTHWSNESANSALPVSLRSRHTGNEAAKASSPYQGGLSPRSNSFKEGLPKSLSSLKNVAKEKSRRRGEGYLSVVNDLMVALPHSEDAYRSDQLENEKLPDVPMEPSSFLASLGKLAVPLNGSQKSIFPSVSPPHYCLCPHGSSTLQFPSALPQLPVSTIESSLLPPLSSFLSSTLLTPTSPLSLADIPSLDFPALLPDPLVRLPIPSSQQILTFTPLMCDPIVHIPVIDVCSSGQGYLVSAGPAISSIIPPLHPKLVNPLVPDSADSLVEKGARETLRFLISSSSSQAGPQLMGVFPAAAVAMTDSGGGKQQSPLVAGSRGLYTGTADVNAIASMGLISFSESTVADGCTGLRNEVDYDLQDNSCGGGLSGDEVRPPFK